MKKFKSVVTICVLIAFSVVTVGHHFALAQEAKAEISEEEKPIQSSLEERRNKAELDAIRFYTAATLSIVLGTVLLAPNLLPPPPRINTGDFFGFIGSILSGFILGSLGGLAFLLGLISLVVGFVSFILGTQSSTEIQKLDQEIKERFPEPTPTPNNPT